MMHVTCEGHTLQPGFNFYPFYDTCSFGFRLLWGDHIYRCRYSRNIGKWMFSKDGNLPWVL